MNNRFGSSSEAHETAWDRFAQLPLGLVLILVLVALISYSLESRTIAKQPPSPAQIMHN